MRRGYLGPVGPRLSRVKVTESDQGRGSVTHLTFLGVKGSRVQISPARQMNCLVMGTLPHLRTSPHRCSPGQMCAVCVQSGLCNQVRGTVHGLLSDASDQV